MGNETFKKVRLYNEDDDVLKKKRLSFLRSKHETKLKNESFEIRKDELRVLRHNIRRASYNELRPAFIFM